MSIGVKPLGLRDRQSNRFRQLNNLLEIVDGRTDMLTLDELSELKSIIINMQTAQGEFKLESSQCCSIISPCLN